MKKYIVLAFIIILSVGSAFAQSKNVSANKPHQAIDSTKNISYVCPMHPEVISAKPGKCPKCGMKLEKKAIALYSCPMHPEVTSLKPGKCPKCDMDLVKVETADTTRIHKHSGNLQ